MKRSASRASKILNDPQDSLENSLPGIPDAKWYEFLEKEDNDLFILGLREEIIKKCLDICFENYLEKQAVAFTVHCAYLAWCKVFNMYYMFRDPGDADDSSQKETWKPDPEPEPSVIDSWGNECIMPLEPKQPQKIDEKFEKTSRISFPKTSYQSLESCSFISEMLDVGEGECFFFPRIFSSPSELSTFQRKSIFTKTLSMSREKLPLFRPAEDVNCTNKKVETKTQKKPNKTRLSDS